MNQSCFQDRTQAGQLLAAALSDFARCSDVLVLGLPRGSVPVASEIARALHAPLDVLVVRKLGLPGQQELAMGAITSGGIRVLNDDVIHQLALSRQTIKRVVSREQRELARCERLYRETRPAPAIAGRTVILVGTTG
jgi:putative phosphoribosyl transferase